MRCIIVRMKKKSMLKLRLETIRRLATDRLRVVAAGCDTTSLTTDRYRGDPITPECPSDYPMCTPT